MSDEYLTTTQAAELLHYSAESIRRRCVQGKIPGARQIDDGRSFWQVPKAWVDSILQGSRPRKR